MRSQKRQLDPDTAQAAGSSEPSLERAPWLSFPWPCAPEGPQKDLSPAPSGRRAGMTESARAVRVHFGGTHEDRRPCRTPLFWGHSTSVNPVSSGPSDAAFSPFGSALGLCHRWPRTPCEPRPCTAAWAPMEQDRCGQVRHSWLHLPTVSLQEQPRCCPRLPPQRSHRMQRVPWPAVPWLSGAYDDLLW